MAAYVYMHDLEITGSNAYAAIPQTPGQTSSVS